MRILLGQLVNSQGFREAKFDMGASTYFNKHYEESMATPYRIGEGHESAADLASSISTSIKDNHFDPTSDEGAALIASQRQQAAEQVLREEDVDEQMFIFPDRAAQNDEAGEEEEKKADSRTTAELLAPIIERQTKAYPKGPPAELQN